MAVVPLMKESEASDIAYCDDRLVNVRDFKTTPLGNGQNADSAFAAAKHFALTWGRQIYWPKGHYVISQTLDLRVGNQDWTQSHMVGENVNGDIVWTYSHTNQSLIEWDGVDNEPIVRVSRSQRVSGLIFRVKPGKTALCGVEWDKHPDGVQGTAVIIENCGFWGDISGVGVYGNLTYGIMVGRSGNTFNLEHGTISNCRVGSVTDYSVYYASTTGQSKYHDIKDCQFIGGKAGIASLAASYSTHCCGFHDMTESAILFRTDQPGSGIVDTINIVNTDSERCARFLDIAGGPTGTRWNVKVDNARFSINDEVAADGEWIQYLATGPFTLINTLWEYAGTYNPNNIYVAMGNSAAVARGRLLSMSNTYLNATPWRNPGLDQGPLVDTLSDKWQGADAVANINSQLGLAIA